MKAQSEINMRNYINSVIDRMPPSTPLRKQIEMELMSTFAERVAQGHSIEQIIQQLGDPAVLAESYLSAIPLVSAPHGRRLGAKIIDAFPLVIIFLVFVGTMMFSSFTSLMDSQPDASVSLRLNGDEIPWLFPGFVFLMPVAWIAYLVFLVVGEYSNGQTFGKRLFGLRVVRESGARISFGQAVLRYLPGTLQMWIIDAIFALFTDRRQRAFEMLTKTRVIDARANP